MQQFTYLLTALLFSSFLSAQSSFNDLHETLEAIANQKLVAGFGVAIVDQNGILYESGYGFADVSTQRAYTTDVVQNIASISKTFIGISLQQAVEDGLFKWDDPINKYLDFPVVHQKYPDQPILIEHLAQHTAGISDDEMYIHAYSLINPEDYTLEELQLIGEDMDEIVDHKPYTLEAFCRAFFLEDGEFYHKKNFTNKAPGEEHVYSNVGAALAALVLSKASGMSFEAWTESRILTPLGMNNSGWHYEDINPKSLARLHNEEGKALPFYTLATFPDGGMLTSIHQLAVYFSAALKGLNSGNTILSKQGYEHIMQSAVIIPDDESQYGHFWEIMGSGFTGHSGGDPGVTTLMFYERETGYGHLAFFNGEAKDPNVYRQVFESLISRTRKIGQ